MNYALYNADCLDIFGQLDPQSMDAVICDPPYGTTACKWDSVIPFAPMWAGIKRVLKPRGACVLFGSQPFTSALVMSNPANYKHCWVWRKTRATNFTSVRYQPLLYHEDILVFYGAGNAFRPIMQSGARYHTRITSRSKIGESRPLVSTEKVERMTRFPSSVIDVPSMRQQDRRHPTQKPLALLEYLVKTYTNAGDTVLDFTMGSGTTGHACGNLDRRFIGIEKDADYFAIAEERIATAYAPLRHMQVAV